MVFLRFLVLLLSSMLVPSVLGAEPQTNLPVNFKLENQAASLEKISNQENGVAFLGGRFKNYSEFLTYLRIVNLVEITGNEDSFVASFRLAFDYTKTFRELDYVLKADVYVMQELSLKARVFENMNPPAFWIKEAKVTLPVHRNHRFIAGIYRPLMSQFPMESYYLPIFYKNLVDQNLRNRSPLAFALVLGNRDLPLPSILANRYDTGLYYQLSYALVKFQFGVSNGEVGMDSNSAKTIAATLRFTPGGMNLGMSLQMGNWGSVPIKETRHFYKLFFYYQTPNGKLHTGLETTLHLHGVRDLSFLNKDHGQGSGALQQQYLYTQGYLTPYSIYNDGSYNPKGQVKSFILYGLSSLIYLEARFLRLLSTAIHLSLYDPNLLSEGSLMYRLKYRGFFRLGVDLTPFLVVYASTTYTYDEVFLFQGQAFDLESRENHYFQDWDLYLGLVYRL